MVQNKEIELEGDGQILEKDVENYKGVKSDLQSQIKRFLDDKLIFKGEKNIFQKQNNKFDRELDQEKLLQKEILEKEKKLERDEDNLKIKENNFYSETDRLLATYEMLRNRISDDMPKIIQMRKIVDTLRSQVNEEKLLMPMMEDAYNSEINRKKENLETLEKSMKLAVEHEDNARVQDLNKNKQRINEELELLAQNLKAQQDKFKENENILIDSEIELEIETKILNSDLNDQEKYKPNLENQMQNIINQNPEFINKIQEFEDLRNIANKMFVNRVEQERFQRKETLKKGSKKLDNLNVGNQPQNSKEKENEQFASSMKRLSMDKNALINSLIFQELEKGVKQNQSDDQIKSNISENLEQFKVDLSKKLNEFISEKQKIGVIQSEIKEANEKKNYDSPVKRKQEQLNDLMEQNLDTANKLEKDYVKYELANQDLASKLINFFQMNEDAWEEQKEEYKELRETLLGKTNKEKLEKKVANARRHSLEAFSQSEQGKLLAIEIKLQLDNLKSELERSPNDQDLLNKVKEKEAEQKLLNNNLGKEETVNQKEARMTALQENLKKDISTLLTNMKEAKDFKSELENEKQELRKQEQQINKELPIASSAVSKIRKEIQSLKKEAENTKDPAKMQQLNEKIKENEKKAEEEQNRLMKLNEDLMNKQSDIESRFLKLGEQNAAIDKDADELEDQMIEFEAQKLELELQVQKLALEKSQFEAERMQLSEFTYF